MQSLKGVLIAHSILETSCGQIDRQTSVMHRVSDVGHVKLDDSRAADTPLAARSVYSTQKLPNYSERDTPETDSFQWPKACKGRKLPQHRNFQTIPKGRPQKLIVSSGQKRVKEESFHKTGTSKSLVSNKLRDNILSLNRSEKSKKRTVYYKESLPNSPGRIKSASIKNVYFRHLFSASGQRERVENPCNDIN
ncbi:hypothetical protein J6590_007708 [Homalodisca vitripennis]|nr:hypothetical protein J6590_007708 [Homalodisca vitripennis]